MRTHARVQLRDSLVFAKAPSLKRKRDQSCKLLTRSQVHACAALGTMGTSPMARSAEYAEKAGVAGGTKAAVPATY